MWLCLVGEEKLHSTAYYSKCCTRYVLLLNCLLNTDTLKSFLCPTLPECVLMAVLCLTINLDSGDVQNTQRYWTSIILPSESDCGIITPQSNRSSAKATAEHYTTSIPPVTVYPNRKLTKYSHREKRSAAVRSNWANICDINLYCVVWQKQQLVL